MRPPDAERRPRREGGDRDDALGGGYVTANLQAGADIARSVNGSLTPFRQPETRACAWCRGPLPARRRRFCTDLCRRRGQRAERVTEDHEYLDVARRMMAHAARRAASDAATFGALVALDAEVHGMLADAAAGLHARDYSWADIGRACGITRQGAQQRWGES